MPRTGRPPGPVPYYQPADVVARPKRKSLLTPDDIKPLPMPTDAIDLIAWANLPRRKVNDAQGSVVLPVALRALLVHIAVRQGEIISLAQIQDMLDIQGHSAGDGLRVLEAEGFIRNLHPSQHMVVIGKTRGRRFAVNWQKLREVSQRNRVTLGSQYKSPPREPRRRSGLPTATS